MLTPTNQLVTQRVTVFGGAVLAAAILDRFAHHATVITTKGEELSDAEAARLGLAARVPGAVLGLKNGRSHPRTTDPEAPGKSKERRMHVLPVDHFPSGGLV